MSTTLDLVRAADLLLATSWEMTPEDFEARLAAFVDESDDKFAALRAVHVAAGKDAAMAKAEADRFTAARKAAERVGERVADLAGRLLRARRELGEEPAVRGVARLQRNGGARPLVYDATFDEAALPERLTRRVVDPSALRAAIEAGEAVQGVTLGEVGEHVRFA